MPQYKLYVAELSGCPVIPLIVTTSFANPGGYLKGEGFVVIPDAKETLLAFTTKFNIKSFSEGGISINEDSMAEGVLEQAKSKFRHYFYEHYVAKGLLEDFKSSDVREIDKQAFISFWYSQNYRKQFIKIGRSTEYEPLEEFIKSVLDSLKWTTGTSLTRARNSGGFPRRVSRAR